MAKKKRKGEKTKAAKTADPAVVRVNDPATPWFVVGLLGFAFAIAAYLGFASWQSGSVAGCGPGSACGDVLSSRWSSWLGIPVSLLALPFYILLALAAMRLSKGKSAEASERWTSVALASSLVIGWAALWFTFIQAGVIGRFCPWCLTAHAAGLLAALMVCGSVLFPGAKTRRLGRLTNRGILHAAVVGCLGVGLLVGGQLSYQPDTFTVVELSEEAPPEAEAVEQKVVSQPRDSLRLHGGRFQLKPSEYPILGQTGAPHVMLSLFDYTCHHCRSTHKHLASLIEAFPDELAILSLPTPLNTDCNPLMQRMGSKTPEAHKDACDYAALSLAVFRLKPETWQGFDDWLFAGKEPPLLEVANARAIALVGDVELLRRTMQDRWISEQVGLAVEIYEANMQAKGQGRMPQLIVGNSVLTGAVNDPNKLFALVREQFGLKKESNP